MAEYDSQKAICKALMLKMFGPTSASRVDSMNESDCISLCQEKVRKSLGETGVSRFDALVREYLGQSVKSKRTKEQCRQIMFELFGPVSAKKVDSMSEDECVRLCQEKVRSLLGDKVAERFDGL